MFIDYNFHAEIRERMILSLAASAEGLFRVMGFDRPEIRRSNLSMDKYYKIVCSYVQTLLGLEVNTRDMTVSLPQDK